MTVTIEHIAAKAKVTKNSVSVALRGKKGVSEATRKRIFEVAKDLGYTPNLAARSLVNGKSGLVGMIIADNIDFITQKKISEIEKRLLEKGYHILLSIAHSSTDENKYIDAFRARKVEAIIVFSTGKSLYSDRCSCPIVALDCITTNPNVNVVRIDREHGIVEATNFLLELGHTDIALVVIKSGSEVINQRIAGIQNTFKRRGLVYDSSLITYADACTQNAFYNATYQMLQKKSPTAIIGQNDLFCMGIRSAIYKHGLRIPEDISLIGHDDFDFAPHFSPALTSIRQPIEQVAEAVVNMLCDLLENGPKESSQEIVLKGKLIVRDSTMSVLSPLTPIEAEER